MPQLSIYLDNSTTAIPSKKTISAMMPFYTDFWGSVSSPHQKGQELQNTVKDSYKTLYRLIGAEEEDTFLLTASGAEAVSQMVDNVYRHSTLHSGKNQFLTSQADEAPAVLAMGRLEQLGCTSKMVKVNEDGIITAASLADAISPRTALLSISMGNGLTGVIQPLSEIAALCRQRGILLHLEVTHTLGKLFVDFKEIGADFISFNGEQLHAPKGSGGLFIKKGVKFTPSIVGGSVNMPALVGLAAAAAESFDSSDYISTEIARLRGKLEQGILTGLPDAKILFNEQERLPHISCIAFPKLSNEALLFILNRKGVFATMGGGQFQQLSLILEESGLPKQYAQGALSFSLSRYTTENEIDQAIHYIVESVRMLQKMAYKMEIKP